MIRQRMEFEELMRDRFVEVIERATGRSVIGFMSGNQQDPDDLLSDANDASGGSGLPDSTP